MKVKKKIPLKIRVEDTRMMPMNSVGIYRMKQVSSHGGIVPCTLKAISGKSKYRLSSHTGIYSIDDKTSLIFTLKGKDDRSHGDQTW